jgi:ATP-dependent helicase HrpA
MSISRQIQRIRRQLPRIMLRYREGLSRRLEKICGESEAKGASGRLPYQLNGLEKRIEKSVLEMEGRLARRPLVTYPDNLPIAANRDKIINALIENQVVIISGETGCGKSTQLPKMCMEAGRGIAGKIGCTQPRRIAATTIGYRIAEELGEDIGLSVGYKIRFSDKTSPDAYIKIMTDGMLLAETQHDPRLYEYDTLIIDEAHERSLNIDFLLGIVKTLLVVRPELKLIITSATLETEKFSAAFDDAPVVEVGGRMYPVEVEYMPIDPELEDAGEITYVDMAVKAVDMLQGKCRFEDILIFMPTEQDILETCDRLEGRAYPGATILPLYARLAGAEQQRVYAVAGQKIVVATNVAETSLTIPGITYVIDTGLARISRYVPSSRTTSLPISPISQSSADQRMGRCGRIQDGICIRLYSKEGYESRPPFTTPEILRSNLAEVILRMIFLNLGDIASFPFVDRPNRRSIKDGFDLLVELGAIVRNGKVYSLTEKGRIMARMPMDPRISRMIIEARKEGCVREVAIIASALSIQDPRERPLEKASMVDQTHAPFRDSDSDFITLLNIWNRYHHTWERLKTQNKMRKFCKEHFLSYARMREWVYTHEQITTILKGHKIGMGGRRAREMTEPLYAGIHKSILSGYLSNIALKKDKNIYLTARGREAMTFPGSTLFNKGCPWIVAAEMVKTSRLFARTAARIQPEWLETLGGKLCRYTYSHPHWEKKRGEVRAFEKVTLYGFEIVSGRAVPYGSINPEESHKIFIQSALVEGDVKEPFAFLTHNLKLIGKLAGLEEKVRRRDILVSEDVIAEFYSCNLSLVYDIHTLKKAINERGGDEFLRLREDDLVLSRPGEQELSQYPDHVAIGETWVKTSYKFAPGKDEDGVTISIPYSLASKIPVERLEWGIPGLFKEKLTALIKGLPKRYRKALVPVSKTVEVIAEKMEHTDKPLITALAEVIYQRFGVDIPPSAWSSVEIPEYLNTRFSLIDHNGKELGAGRDISVLRRTDVFSPGKIEPAAWKQAQKKWEKSGITSWDFGSLPESIRLGPHLLAYPALEPVEESVNIHLFPTLEQASVSHKKGVEALFLGHLKKDLKFLKRNLSLPGGGAEGANYFGGVRAVEKALYESLLRTLFHRNLRTGKEFYAYAETLKSTMLLKGKELRDKVVQVLQAYHQTRSALHSIEKANRSNSAVLALCGEIREELDTLIPQDFIPRYPVERLVHFPRYLKAMQIRAVRGANDPEKDRARMAEAEVFIRGWRKMTKDLSVYASQEKRQAVEAYGWMVEEFKVSLFAQELKTPFPVSAKRLEEKREEIDRTV